MKMILPALLIMMISAEAFAQRGGGGRAGRGGGGSVRPARPSAAPRATRPQISPRVTRPQVPSRPSYRPGPVRPHVRVAPRYVVNRHSYRTLRITRRAPIIWSTGFGYACTYGGQLLLNSLPVHNFYSEYECSQAISDIRIYGDFCDREDLYDQSGILEAQFNSDYECREALGYFY